VIAVDTNILVYSHRRDSPWNSAAAECVRELAEGSVTWAIPWQCVHEFFGVTTNPRLWRDPSTPEEAIRQLALWLDSPQIVLLTEGPDHWKTLQAVLGSSGVKGPRVHDARIVALCIQHGVSALWSADRDFSRFAGLKVVNPLVR
jgi:toxin-antitoxin system PIN domain toxin